MSRNESTGGAARPFTTVDSSCAPSPYQQVALPDPLQLLIVVLLRLPLLHLAQELLQAVGNFALVELVTPGLK